jgi:epoxyqueuosine reductase
MVSCEKTPWICERARILGLDLCGVVALPSPSDAFDSNGVLNELTRFSEWLARGYAGEMNYLHDARRADPRRILDGARSLIVVATNYNSSPRSATTASAATHTDSPRGWISRYAWGDDYHKVLRQKLIGLIREMRAQFSEPFEARAYVDTGPILERVAAKYAGLGWLAKNTCLINSQLGSWLFLGVIITTLSLDPTLPSGQAPPADLCGTCTRCLDACPTQAFPEPYVLDARRCISYLTIELRSSIPKELRANMSNATIGCDICQDVCPWNRKAPVTTVPAFQPRESLLAPELEKLISLSQEQFSVLFRGSAAKRAKWRGLVRNACIGLANSTIEQSSPAYARILALLENLAASADSLIAEHANWALSRIRDAASSPNERDSAGSAAAARSTKTQ